MTCVGKRRWPDLWSAQQCIKAMQKKKTDTKNLMPYQCPICRKWHVGNLQGIREKLEAGR